MRFKRGDIVITAPGTSKACLAIVKIHDDFYETINVLTGRTLRAKDSQIADKIGTATASLLDENQSESIGRLFRAGRKRAETEAKYAPTAEARRRWEILAKTEPGDKIQVYASVGGKLEEVEFRHVIDRGIRFVFAARQNGSMRQFVLDALALPVAKE